MEDTLRVKLKAFRDDGGYIKYVFQDLDKEAHFILCTKFPNWDTPLIKIDDRGFLRYKESLNGMIQKLKILFRINMMQFNF